MRIVERISRHCTPVIVAALLALPGVTGAYPEGLLLYDSFDDETAFARTEAYDHLVVSPDFGLDGNLRYFEPGYWGSGATTASYLNFIADGRFGAAAGFNYSGNANGWASQDEIHYPVGEQMTPREGTIEFWYRPHFDENDTSAVMSVIQGFKSRVDLPLETYYERNRTAVTHLYWSYHGWSGRHYWTFGIVEFGPTGQRNYDVLARTPPETSPDRFRFAAETWMHVGLAWKSDGIPGQDGKTLVMYIDGVEVASTTEAFNPTQPFDPYLVVGGGLGQNFDPSLPGDNYSGASGDIDEVRVWDFAKTDFSDRFGPLAGAIVRDVAGITDLNRNGTTELATLRAYPDDTASVVLKDSLTKEWLGEIDFVSPDRTPLGLAGVVDASGRPGIAVLFRKPNGQGIVQIRDALTGEWIHEIYFFGELWEVEAISSQDADGDGVSEVAVLGRLDDGSRAAIQVKDADSRLQFNWIELPME